MPVKRFTVFVLVFTCGTGAGYLLSGSRPSADGTKARDYPVRVSVHHFQHLDRPAEVADVISVEDKGSTNRIGDQSTEGKRVRIDLTYPDRTVVLFGVER
jgi:hypothetical protein